MSLDSPFLIFTQIFIDSFYLHASYCSLQFEELAEGRDCVLECGPDKKCFPETCCAVREKGEKNDSQANNTSHSPPPDLSIRQRSNGSGSGGTAAASTTISIQNPDNKDIKDVAATAI